MTNRDAHKLIRAVERIYSGRNITRWYSTVHPKRNGEARVRTWAVKTWKGKPLIMLAAEYHTDGKQAHVSGRCLVNNFMHTKAFNWLDYGGNSHVAVWSDVDSCRDEWCEAYAHEFGRGTEFFGEFLNDFSGTKYEYSAWDRSGMRITDYLDCYHVSPLAELIVKSGLRRWLTPSHVAKLAQNKPLARFVAANSTKLRSVPPNIIQREFKRHGARANIGRMAALAELTPYGLTKLAFAPERIWNWMQRNHVTASELRHHVDNLKELHKSLAYEPHVLPHDWPTYSLAIDERVKEVRELAIEREREIVRKARADARRMIDTWVKIGKVRKAYKIVVPQSETELHNEGEAMSNCVGGYWHRLKSGHCDLVFIRKHGKPYIDMEVSDGKIVQMRYSHNRAVKEQSADGRLCAMLASAFKAKGKAA